MPTFRRAAVAALLIAGLVPTGATAGSVHRHKSHAARHAYGPVYAHSYSRPYGYAHPRYAYRYPPGYGPTSADPYAPYYREDPYSPYAAPGAAIRAQARRNQYAPGVTNELAPDNIATATGGPSGGVPGFSGH